MTGEWPEMEETSFRRMTRYDLPLLCEWLNRPHVNRWWRRSFTLADVEAEYGPGVDGTEKADVYVIELDGRAGGMIQTYLVSDYPDWIGDEPGVAGLDLFIADEERTGRGLGPRILAEFMRRVVFVDAAVTACVAGPEAGNERSIRAFEKAGFVREREISGEWGPELLLRARRS